MALLLSCWKKQKKFVIRKRPGGVFAAIVTERDRAVWSPSPARAVASRRPGGSARCLGSRSAPPGSPRSPLALGGRRGGGGGGGAQHGQRPLWAGPWCWGALRVSTTEAQRGGRAPSLVTSSWGGGAGLPIPSLALSPSPASLWAAASKACLERHWQSVGSQISYFKGLQMFPKKRDEVSFGCGCEDIAPFPLGVASQFGNYCQNRIMHSVGLAGLLLGH